MMKWNETNSELASIRVKLDEIKSQLDRVEAQQIRPNLQHPSMDRYSIAEAIVDELFAAAGNEKACTFEPNGRPCDHCSMCSAQGF